MSKSCGSCKNYMGNGKCKYGYKSGEYSSENPCLEEKRPVTNTTKKKQQTNWNTGTPTEDGEYVCTVIGDLVDRQGRAFKLKGNYLFTFKDGIAENDILGEPHKIIRYFKVPPYKED